VAWCWGYGDTGAIGDNGAFHRNQPVLVAGGLTFSQLSAGYYHTCGLQSGAAWCWGDNGAQLIPGTAAGILGTGSIAGLIAQPAQVTGGLQFTELAAGMGFTCGRLVSGALRCWGVNLHGNLGDQTNTIRTAPTAVFAQGTFASIAAGAFHACARSSGNEVWCWGRNAFGQVGDGTSQSRSQPTKVLGPTLFTRLSANASNTCAVSVAGDAWCWGNGGGGAVGDGTTQNKSSPVRVRP
jgi:alpha-tubulin suppressor-like RCC1 family protein